MVINNGMGSPATTFEDSAWRCREDLGEPQGFQPRGSCIIRYQNFRSFRSSNLYWFNAKKG